MGFPESALDRVINKLEDENISYQIVYSDSDPVIKWFDENKYDYYSKLASQKISLEERIELIQNKVKTLDDEQVEEILRLIECIK